jgi:membrane protein implicated in regulation of membrane protease activity
MDSKATQALEQRDNQLSDKRLTQIGWIIIGTAGVLAFGLLALIVYMGYLVLIKAAPEVTAAVIAASGTILVSGLGYFYARIQQERSARQERQSELEKAQHDQRAPIYADFMQFWIRIFTAQEDDPVSRKERAEHLEEFGQKIVAWGSDDFLRAYSKLRGTLDFETYQAYKFGLEDDEENRRRFLAFERVLFIIRSDLGYSNATLRDGALLRMFLPDRKVDMITQASERGAAELQAAEDSRTKEEKSHEHI